MKVEIYDNVLRLFTALKSLWQTAAIFEDQVRPKFELLVRTNLQYVSIQNMLSCEVVVVTRLCTDLAQ